MKTVLSLAFAAAVPFAAPSGDPSLAVQVVPGAVEFTVAGPSAPFIAGVLLSLTPGLAHYVVGLPPLLANHVVAGIGFVEREEYFLSVPEVYLPPGVMIQVQGVTFDGVAFGASKVDEFVLDASADV